MKLELPRGLRDIEPQEFDKVEWLRERFFETLDLFGFEKMEPSPLENLSTLETKSGPSIVDEIYCFKDKGQRDLGLRFDLTVGISRYVSSRRDLEFPTKIGAFSGVWRYDEPQHGRYRWFYQWDAEIYGRPQTESDAEIIELSTTYFNKVGLRDVRVEVSDRTVVEEYIKEILGVKEEWAVNELLRMLDKTTKKSEKEILAEYTSKGFSEEKIYKVLSVSKISGRPENVVAELERLGLKKTGDLRNIAEELESRKIGNFQVNLGIVRGIDYYSGVVYEFYEDSLSKLALAGGGRYDKLMQVFGRSDISATGVAGGVERLLMALEQRRTLGQDKRKEVFVAYAGEALKRKAQNITSELRREGYSSATDLYSRDLKRQLAYASKHFRYTVIVAPLEDRQECCIIKDLESGEEEKISYSELFEKIRDKLS
ncbi:MAG: histidine--tRNA ligase [Nitrososphaeria archaeon]